MDGFRLMLPSVVTFKIDPPRSAWETSQRIGPPDYICMRHFPTGNRQERVDVECVEMSTADTFSLEIMRGAVRVYVGKMDPYDDAIKAGWDKESARIADNLKPILQEQDTTHAE